MKLKYILLAAAAIVMFTACGDDNKKHTGYVESITVNGEGYQKHTLEEDTDYFTDHTYKITGIPKYFTGFDMLISSANSNNGGSIIPLFDGLVYVIAPAGGLLGWKAIPNTANDEQILKHSTDTEDVLLSIYCMVGFEGNPIEIPKLQGLSCVTPIARSITY